MPWYVEYGRAETKEDEANPPPGMMKASGPFPSEQAALNDAAGRLGLGVTNVVVKDGNGEVVADMDAVHAHARRARPAG